MTIFDLALVLSILFCSLVAGFLFAYAVVVMPGLEALDDKEFIKAFQVTDRVIQNNNPLFLLVWVGSTIALIVCAYYGFAKLHGIDLFILLIATIGYLLGVQVSTLVIHLPLNNNLQKIEFDNKNAEELNKIRRRFEPRWNKANEIRTAIACGTSLLLIVLAVRQ
jgi:uncharacterized membrane protein